MKKNQKNNYFCKMEISYLLLGGNVGDRMEYLRRSVELLERDAGNVIAISSVYESEPWGFDHPQWFLNQAVALETNLSPPNLLEKIRRIENTLGRQRTTCGYQARTIDIDIILYANLAFNSPELVIPHPRMTERLFVMLPMAELAPNVKHPQLNLTMTQLRENCSDAKQARKFNKFRFTTLSHLPSPL